MLRDRADVEDSSRAPDRRVALTLGQAHAGYPAQGWLAVHTQATPHKGTKLADEKSVTWPYQYILYMTEYTPTVSVGAGDSARVFWSWLELTTPSQGMGQACGNHEHC